MQPSRYALLISVTHFCIFMSTSSLMESLVSGVKRHMKCHVLAVISDITRENEVQIQFLSHCNHTLVMQRVAGVWVEGWNTISLAAQLIQTWSVMIVLVALIVMLRNWQPSSSDTSSSHAFMNSYRAAITRSSCDGASVIIPRVPSKLFLALFSTTAKTNSATSSAFWAGMFLFITGSASDCETSSLRSTSYTTSCIIAEGTGTVHFPRSVAERLRDSLRGLQRWSGHKHINGSSLALELD